MGAAQLEFFDPLEARVLPRSDRPFWTLNVKVAGGRMSQKPYRLRDLEWVLRNVNPRLDTYMSQAFFDRPCRRALHVSWLTHAYVDLDIYRLPVPPNPHHAPHWVRQHCHDNNIPPPSLIIFSGRGIFLKWCWRSPIPRAAAGRAVAVNRTLVKAFAEFGADPACVDVSRILRVVGTTNSKSGEVAKILWQEEHDGDVATYDFGAFADEILLYTLEQVRGFRAEQAAKIALLAQERAKRRPKEQTGPGRRAFSWDDWHWGVLEDIRWLANHRWNGTVPPGQRDLIGHLAACQLARVIPASQLWHEVQALGRLILPADYVSGSEFRQHCSTLLANAQRAARGEKVAFGGKAYAPVYTYRKDTLIDRLGITSDEMRHLTRLIDADEKRRRDREATVAARRSNGVMPRKEYEARSEQRRITAKVLAAEGKVSTRDRSRAGRW
ncbi:MAG: hypothetical protein ACJ8AW_55025 [Rhodopila sp.]